MFAAGSKGSVPGLMEPGSLRGWGTSFQGLCCGAVLQMHPFKTHVSLSQTLFHGRTIHICNTIGVVIRSLMSAASPWHVTFGNYWLLQPKLQPLSLLFCCGCCQPSCGLGLRLLSSRCCVVALRVLLMWGRTNAVWSCVAGSQSCPGSSWCLLKCPVRCVGLGLLIRPRSVGLRHLSYPQNMVISLSGSLLLTAISFSRPLAFIYCTASPISIIITPWTGFEFRASHCDT